MTISQMLGQSLILTGLGMGVVFSFLIIMVVSMIITTKVIKAFKLDKEDEPAQTATASPAQNNAVIAAIAACVRENNL